MEANEVGALLPIGPAVFNVFKESGKWYTSHEVAPEPGEGWFDFATRMHALIGPGIEVPGLSCKYEDWDGVVTLTIPRLFVDKGIARDGGEYVAVAKR